MCVYMYLFISYIHFRHIYNILISYIYLTHNNDTFISYILSMNYKNLSLV